MNAKTHLLLTGAGFTKNFGAPLATEMWNIVPGSPFLKGLTRLRSVLLEDFDYESVYHRVMTGDFSADEKAALSRSAKAAYGYIDNVIEPHPHFH